MEDRIIIVGAGPVGLVTALLLHERGLEFTLVEQAESLPDDLRASTFHPPTLDMLDRLDVTPQLIARGLISPTWQIRMHPSGEHALFDLGVLSDETAHPYRLQCTQSTLCHILLERLNALGGDIRLGHRAVAASQNGDSVSLTCRTVDDDEVVLTGSWLIGTDGARSIVRKSMDTGFEGSVYPETTILATTTFPFHDHLTGLSNVNYVWHAAGTFSMLRLPDTWRCSLYPDTDESLDDATTLRSITRKLDRIVPGAGAFGVGEIRPYKIHRRIADNYRDGRFVLAGDAAHLNSPSGGMGMNGGIHDAFELVASLGDWADGGGEAVIDRYVARRQPIAMAEIIEQAHRNRSRMQERDPDKRRAMLAELQAVTADRARAKDHLLRSSMITGLRKAAQIA